MWGKYLYYPTYSVFKVVHYCLWFSKLKYGLQLCGNTRTCEEEGQNTDMKAIQTAPNRLLRMLHVCPIKDIKVHFIDIYMCLTDAMTLLARDNLSKFVTQE